MNENIVETAFILHDCSYFFYLLLAFSLKQVQLKVYPCFYSREETSL